MLELSWSQVEAKLKPSWGQFAAKLGQAGAKLRPSWGQVGPSWGHVGAKLGQVGSKNRLLEGLGAQEPPRATQDRFKPENRSKKPPPGRHVGRLFGPCWPPRATKRPFKKHAKFWSMLMSIFHRFGIDFGSVLGGFWQPCWPPRCTITWAPILNDFLIVFLLIFAWCWPPRTLSFDK